MSDPSLSASMLRFSISGPDPSQRLLKGLREGQLVRIGRRPRDGWAIPWDRAISREHADLRWDNGQIRIVKLPNARNPIIYRDRMVKELTIDPGD
jgi:pSer/pThr/pTyr-binding forkhead associated (FHA) protein